MAKTILVFGLPGSGKSTLANKLMQKLADAEHINADKVREMYDDWDFSDKGRERQAHRMYSDKWSTTIVNDLQLFDWKNPTVQMLGRWQPWHPGHRALFERCVAKTGQVAIQVRDVAGASGGEGQGDNPFDFELVKENIVKDLSDKYTLGKEYIIMQVPNIVNITYGRGVGYVFEQETFDDSIHDISATKIRAQMRAEGKLE